MGLLKLAEKGLKGNDLWFHDALTSFINQQVQMSR